MKPSERIRRFEFGRRSDGRSVEAIELCNAAGMRARVLTMGAIVQALLVRDRRGEFADVVLGHATVAEYEAARQYFGATVGRFANRIANGRFESDGERFVLDLNNGANHLHGGAAGFDAANWHIESLSAEPVANVVLSHVSPHGEGGYPGTVRVLAHIALHDDDTLELDYRAHTDRPTIVNITHHGYFNLCGEGRGDVLHHCLRLHAETFTPVDAGLIPTGECRGVSNSPFDFRELSSIGARIRENEEQLQRTRGYDHNFIVSGPSGELRPVARVEEPLTGRTLDVFATAPGVQFYSGNFLNATSVGKRGNAYRQSDGFCLEPQAFPNAPNTPHFPRTRLEPGETYRQRMVYRFGVT